MFMHRTITGDIRTLSVKRDRVGDWFITVTAESLKEESRYIKLRYFIPAFFSRCAIPPLAERHLSSGSSSIVGIEYMTRKRGFSAFISERNDISPELAGRMGDGFSTGVSSRK